MTIRVFKIILIALFLSFTMSFGQETEKNSTETVNKIVCPHCKSENESGNKFCGMCGKELLPAEQHLIIQAKPRTFGHKVGRLFSIPSADVLRSLDLSLILGGSFGISNSNGWLGTLSFGLGGYGDVEVSTASFLGSIFSETEKFTSIGLKLALINEKEFIPGLAIGLRTNNDWNKSSNTDIRTISPELGAFGLTYVSYDTRMTTFYISFSKQMNPIARVHLGGGVSDIRYKNVYSYFIEPGSSYYEPNIQRENMYLVFGGFDMFLSDRTNFLFEVQTIPYFKVDPKTGKIEPAQRVVGAAGLRFIINHWLVLDSGVRYQDNYKGLADAEIKISLNGFLNLGFR